MRISQGERDEKQPMNRNDANAPANHPRRDGRVERLSRFTGHLKSTGKRSPLPVDGEDMQEETSDEENNCRS